MPLYLHDQTDLNVQSVLFPALHPFPFTSVPGCHSSQGSLPCTVLLSSLAPGLRAADVPRSADESVLSSLELGFRHNSKVARRPPMVQDFCRVWD